jgi:hypothetical protein
VFVDFTHPFHFMVIEKLLEAPGGDFEKLKSLNALGVLLFNVT